MKQNKKVDINKKFITELININYCIKTEKFEESFCRIVEKEYTKEELEFIFNLVKNTYPDYEFKLKYKEESNSDYDVIWYKKKNI